VEGETGGVRGLRGERGTFRGKEGGEVLGEEKRPYGVYGESVA
jgi:hypothetical protein